MTDPTGAPAGSEAMPSSTPASDANPRSLSDMIAEARQGPEEPEQSAESAETATAEQELAPEANAESPSETVSEDKSDRRNSPHQGHRAGCTGQAAAD